jgi:orotidine-5'-phosphate decarboxylase
MFRLPADRLIVAADFEPPPDVHGPTWVHGEYLKLAEELRGLGVYIKANSALRARGYSLIEETHELGLRFFADLKLCDIKETLKIDGALLRSVSPDILTVMACAGSPAIAALKDKLPETELLAVTWLTSLGREELREMFATDEAESLESIVLRLGKIAARGHVDGFVSSAKEVPAVRAEFGLNFTTNAPAIRPASLPVAGDDQNKSRIVTPAQAFILGASRIVVGRPITQAVDRRAATIQTLHEIEMHFPKAA